jgi:UDPglucose--hexose-1-phosphate uridylyltransferase
MSELRKDPIVDRWVIVAAERGRRPNDFRTESDPLASAFDPFAPGHEDRTPPEIAAWGRPAGAPPNSPDWQVRVVPNKFPALCSVGELDPQGLGMFDLMNGIGAHEVIIENPAADWDMANAAPEEVVAVLRAYVERLRALRKDERFRSATIFRNVGAAAGATLAHAHSQIIALPIVPKQLREQLDAAHEYYARKGRCIFTDIIRQETAMNQRVVESGEQFAVLCPFAPRFPFELRILPLRHSHDFALIGEDELSALAAVLARSLRRIKSVLGAPAYNLMLHTAPLQTSEPGRPGAWSTLEQDFLWHIDILPRLTKTAGFEWGTGLYINPVSPESAAQFLKEAVVDG